MIMKDETALITGSTRGLGKQAAELMLKAGGRVAICARNEKHVLETVGRLRKLYGERVIGRACDVSDFDDLKKLINYTVSCFGSVRILIANAGISPVYGPFRYLSEEEIIEITSSIISTNMIGAINSIGAVLPAMLQQQYGRIVTLTGGGDSRPLKNFSLYSASKGGILSFSRCLAKELEQEDADIKLNIFQPGPMKTDLNRTLNLVKGWKDEETFHVSWKNLIDTVDSDIEDCARKIIPYILPACRYNGRVFRGFSFLKMLPKLIKIKKALDLV